MTQANNIAVTLGWLVGSYKIANAEEMIVKSLKAQVKDLPKDGVLDLWYDMTNRKAKLNAGDWCSGAEIDAWKTALIEHAAVDTAADIEIMDEAGGPGDGDWVKIASAVGTDIRDSAISGKGLFATRSFSTGDVLVTDFMQKQNTDDPRTRWEQSDACRYTNHSDKPNAFIRKLGETVELVADETIQPNEEITCNYRDASKTLGKAFFYTYRGKPYGNEPSSAAFMQKTAATKPDTFYGLATFLKQAQTGEDIVAGIAAEVWEKLAADMPAAVGTAAPTSVPKPPTAIPQSLTLTESPLRRAEIQPIVKPPVRTPAIKTPMRVFDIPRAAEYHPELRATQATSVPTVPVRRQTPADHISPYYGGRPQLAKAVEAANMRMQSRPADTRLSAFSKWLPEDIDNPVDIRYVQPMVAHPNRHGDHTPYGGTGDGPLIRIFNDVNKPREAADIKATLDHELTHAMTGKREQDYKKLPADVTGYGNTDRSFLPVAGTVGDDDFLSWQDQPDRAYLDYATKPVEMDPRLAAVKRHYVYETGESVDTPEQAEKALQYWQQTRDKIRAKAWEEDPTRGGWNPATGTYRDHTGGTRNETLDSFNDNAIQPKVMEWILQHPEAKEIAIQRMLELVQNQQTQNFKQAQTTDDILDRIANARSQTATEVSAGNAAAGNYRKGRFNYHGLRISIENPKGSTRSGVAADGTKWSNEMKFDYGYIRGTIGADGDPVDVFIGDDPKSELVFIVNQVNKSGDFDEHKVVLGVVDAKQARQTYLANYKPGWTGAGSVIGMTMPQFKAWLKGDVTKPAASVKQAGNRTAIPPCDNSIQAIINMADSAAWRLVPRQVSKLMKQAGSPLAALGKVLKRTATTASRVPVPKVVRNAVLPTVKPNPTLVAANAAARTAPTVAARPAAAARTVARPQPTAIGGMRAPVRNTTVAPKPAPHPAVAAVIGKLRGARDSVANVPKGEAFSQRPIANTGRLMVLDGVPGMRLVNRAALGAAGYTAGSHLIDANNAVNGAIDTSASQLGDYFDSPQSQRDGFSDDLYNAKWNVLQDQTLGAAGRWVQSLLGRKPDDHVASQDAAIRAVAMEAVRRAVHAPEDGAAKPSLLQRVLAKRSPIAVVADNAPTLMQRLVDKPSTLRATGRVVDNIRRSGVDVSNPTAVEQALRDNFGSMYARLTPQQLDKLRRDIAIGTAVGVTATR